MRGDPARWRAKSHRISLYSLGTAVEPVCLGVAPSLRSRDDAVPDDVVDVEGTREDGPRRRRARVKLPE